MKLIPLSRGLFAIVDDADYHWLMQWAWYAGKGGNTFYAQREFRKPNGKETTVMMHRVILGLTDPKIRGDHQDGNGLNNQRYNLRVATRAQNSQNRGTRFDNVSGVHGICWRKDVKKWQARIGVNYKRISLGFFSTIDAAKAARTAAELKYYGQFSPTLSRKKPVQGVSLPALIQQEAINL